MRRFPFPEAAVDSARQVLDDVLPEWPTWGVIVAAYGLWLVGVGQFQRLGPVAGTALLVGVTCWFMSVQHELLHGHPTGSRRVNRGLGLAPLAVWYPYDLYRQSHLAHHRDELLTEPGLDPESNYLSEADFHRLPGWCRPLWVAQRTVVGRLLLGPAMVIVPTWLDIVRKPLRGDFSQCGVWLQHGVLLGLLLWALDRFAGIGPLRYALTIGYPALGLAMLRSFYEHRPADDAAHRVVVVEAGGVLAAALPEQQLPCGAPRGAGAGLAPDPPPLPGRPCGRARPQRRVRGRRLPHALPPPRLPADRLAGAPRPRRTMTLRRPVSLPMYDADPAAVQAWWEVIAAAMRDEGVADVPASVEWPTDLDAHWRDPSLLLSQTCGYPLVTGLQGAVRVVGAFRYTAPGCVGIDYRSALMVREGDAGASIEPFRGRVAVVNDPTSHSGSNSLRGIVAPLARDGRFFREWKVSGSHRRSLEMLRDGLADVAAIDCITLAALERAAAGTGRGLRSIGLTHPVPGLPLVTAAGTPADELERLRRAFERACADPAAAALRAHLFIVGFERVDAAHWQPVEAVRASAVGLV